MKIINKKNNEIINSKETNARFTSTFHNDLKIKWNFLNKNFYLDTYNYFPITDIFETFLETFLWGDKLKYKNFYTDDFFLNFNNNIKNFKLISNVYILGSSSNDNYYRNIVTFLPRLFFIKDKKFKLAIHRSSSNKFRNFIKYISLKMNKNVQFVYLDDGFFSFNDCKLPQFFSKKNSVKILNSLKIKTKKKEKIYVVRQNSLFRNILNEGDIIDFLKKNNFRIVDLNQYSIMEQIKIFSNAEVVVSATGSGLTNIVFCNKGTKVIEIAPEYKFDYEKNFEIRFYDICNFLNHLNLIIKLIRLLALL